MKATTDIGLPSRRVFVGADPERRYVEFMGAFVQQVRRKGAWYNDIAAGSLSYAQMFAKAERDGLRRATIVHLFDETPEEVREQER